MGAIAFWRTRRLAVVRLPWIRVRKLFACLNMLAKGCEALSFYELAKPIGIKSPALQLFENIRTRLFKGIYPSWDCRLRINLGSMDSNKGVSARRIED